MTVRHFDISTSLNDRKLSASQSSLTAAVRSSAAGFVISPYDIVIFSFTPANSGTDAIPAGVHGKFEFRVTPPDTRTSAYSSGTITASPVANDISTSLNDRISTSLNDRISTSLNDRISTSLNDRLRAWVQNGILYVDGLAPGTTWRVYTLTGTLIYTGNVEARLITPLPGYMSSSGRVSLPGRGIYIIVSEGKNSVKVVY